MTTARFAVIIPFYQRQPGLLRRAAASVIAQQGIGPVQLIVVDDGSPVSAESEIDADMRAQLPQLTIVNQANGGVGRARNAGLNVVSPAASLVAFLDSDDTWVADHLARAAQVTEAGVDVFFGVAAEDAAYERSDEEKWPSGSLLGASVAGVDDVRLLTRDAATYTLRYGLPIQSVVFRRSIAPDLRFATDVRRAGEDLRFTFELVRRAGAVAFSARPEVILGRGVNIYRSTIGHGATSAIPRMIDEIHTRMALESQVTADAAWRQLNSGLLHEGVSSLAVQTLHAARRLRLKDLAQVLLFNVRHPRLSPRFLREVATGIFSKATGAARSAESGAGT